MAKTTKRGKGTEIEKLLTYADVVEITQLSLRTVKTLVKRGDLEHTRLGNSVRFTGNRFSVDRAQHDEWIQLHRRGREQ